MSDPEHPAVPRVALVRELLRPLALARDVDGGWLGDLLGRTAWPEQRLPLLAAWTSRWSADGEDDDPAALPIVHARPLPASAPEKAAPALARAQAALAPTPPPAPPATPPARLRPLTARANQAEHAAPSPPARPLAPAPDPRDQPPTRPRLTAADVPRVVAAFRGDRLGPGDRAPRRDAPPPATTAINVSKAMSEETYTSPALAPPAAEPALAHPARDPAIVLATEPARVNTAEPARVNTARAAERARVAPAPAPAEPALAAEPTRAHPSPTAEPPLVHPAPAPSPAEPPPQVRARPAGSPAARESDAAAPLVHPGPAGSPAGRDPDAAAPLVHPAAGRTSASGHALSDMSERPLNSGPRARAVLRPAASEPVRARPAAAARPVRPAVTHDGAPTLAPARPHAETGRHAAGPAHPLPHLPVAAPLASAVPAEPPVLGVSAQPAPAPTIDVEALIDTIKRRLTRELGRARELRRAIR